MSLALALLLLRKKSARLTILRSVLFDLMHDTKRIFVQCSVKAVLVT